MLQLMDEQLLKTDGLFKGNMKLIRIFDYFGDNSKAFRELDVMKQNLLVL